MYLSLHTLIYTPLVIPKPSICKMRFELSKHNPEFAAFLLNTSEAVSDRFTAKAWSNEFGKMYYVLKYDRSKLNDADFATRGLLRSVVVDAADGRVVAYAPPKMLRVSRDDTRTITPPLVAQEFVEGTMFNLFWDTSDTGGFWEIATKSCVGLFPQLGLSADASEAEVAAAKLSAEASRAHQNSFRDLFFETVAACKLDLNVLPRHYSYSFVVQHPKKKIVNGLNETRMYLIAIYHCVKEEAAAADGMVSVTEIPRTVDACGFDWSQTLVRVPETYVQDSGCTVAQLAEKYSSLNTPVHLAGVVVYNTETGERFKFRNPVFERVKLSKGRDSNLRYTYLTCRKDRTVAEYLKQHPEHADEFSSYRNMLHMYTTTLFKLYIECYVKKQQPLGNYPREYRTMMYQLHHNVYLGTMREQKKFVTLETVITFVNGHTPLQQLAFLLTPSSYARTWKSNHVRNASEVPTAQDTDASASIVTATVVDDSAAITRSPPSPPPTDTVCNADSNTAI